MTDHRKEKRYFRQHEDHVYFAWLEGQEAARDLRKPKRNPFPAGRRHDEWERGYREADPMGEHHGRNE